MSIRLPRIAGVLLATGLLFGTATPAFAEDARSDDDATEETHGLRDRCDRAIDRRLTDLANAQNRVAGVEVLTDAHAATINGIIDSTEAGLAAHAVELAEADDRVEIVQLCTEIATNFRVYLVVLPQTHLTVGADRVDAAVARGDALVAAFDEAVEAAIEAGADVTDAVTSRDAAVAHLDAAAATVAGVADEVLTVTPASYNDGPGQTTIADTRAAVRSAHGELKDGIADGQLAIRKLREALDAVGED